MIGRLEGALLFATICGFIAWQVMRRGHDTWPTTDIHDDVGRGTALRRPNRAYLAGGLIGLPIAAHTDRIRRILASPPPTASPTPSIGLTIVAVGTSLPELATTFAAAFRKTAAVAIGNIVGSNIFNLAGILGPHGAHHAGGRR